MAFFLAVHANNPIGTNGRTKSYIRKSVFSLMDTTMDRFGKWSFCKFLLFFLIKNVGKKWKRLVEKFYKRVLCFYCRQREKRNPEDGQSWPSFFLLRSLHCVPKLWHKWKRYEWECRSEETMAISDGDREKKKKGNTLHSESFRSQRIPTKEEGLLIDNWCPRDNEKHGNRIYQITMNIAEKKGKIKNQIKWHSSAIL